MQESFGRHASAHPSRGARALLLATGLLALAFALGSPLVSWIEAHGAAGGPWLRAVYAPVCHQQPDRCLPLAGVAGAACARCTGLYLGGALGLLLAAWLPGLAAGVGRGWFAAAVAPTLIDAAAPLVGLPGLPNLPRFALSVPTGLVLGLLLAVGLIDLVALAAERRAGGQPCNVRVEGRG